jgi:Tol biopolymer transport system component
MNSYVTNLYLRPTNGATSQRLTPDTTTEATFGAFQPATKAISFDVQTNDAFMTIDGSVPSSTNGHKIYAGRAYTLSLSAATTARFIADAGTAVIFASELTV